MLKENPVLTVTDLGSESNMWILLWGWIFASNDHHSLMINNHLNSRFFFYPKGELQRQVNSEKKIVFAALHMTSK